MKVFPIFVFCLAVLIAAPAAVAQSTVYTWKDEDGVLHYTNTAPPEGAIIVDTEKEVPHDPQEARQREMEQRRYLEQLRRQERLSDAEESAPPEQTEGPAQKMEADSQPQEEDKVEKSGRRKETWHQRQIQKRQRKNLNQGPSPP
ncbi:MAG: DUF4124 domain-containing protein [Desulfobacterales bacterium]|nr:DUF4124 domain-containing protein [Desulfobacterales bacterium]